MSARAQTKGSRESGVLLIGVAASICLHGLVLLPWLSAAADASNHNAATELESPIAPPLPEPDRNEIDLGIDQSLARTMTWIGFEEYEEHLAQLSEIEQAAMTESASGGGPPPAVVTEEVAPKPKPEPKPEPEPNKTPESPSKAADPAPAPVEETEPQPEPDPTPSQPQPKPAPPAPNPAPPRPDPEPGTPSDRESDATSIVDVAPSEWRNGRPLAAHGLELKPRKPDLTILMTITSRFGNPLVEIQFSSNGRPENASIIQSSGDSQVDQAILSSLFGWRATGAPLAEIKPTETIDIQLRMILHEKR